jgi:Domain of unknown function (DUF397)
MAKQGLSFVEIEALSWRKAKESNGAGGMCVEVADLPGGGVALRHSKFPHGNTLTFSDDEWLAFLSGAVAGEFTPPGA